MLGPEAPLQCLGTALMAQGALTKEWDLLKQVIAEHFPERITFYGAPVLGIIPSFNDHPDTTWEDVDKIVREFERRREFLE